MYMLTAQKPAERFCGLFRGSWGGVGGGVGLLTSLVFVLHDLRSDRLFYFVARTSCYVDYFGVGGWGD